ncbi:MAG: TM1802 family CRISPR-associated protein, partial [Thermoproteota archaeon]
MNTSSESLLKTHAVCVDCKMKLRLGLSFIERNLRGSIDGLNMYVIPTIFGTTTFKLIDKLPRLQEAFNVVVSYEWLKDLESKMSMYREFEDPSLTYMLNVLFGHRVSSHFAYQHLIQNVPVTRLLEVSKKFRDASSKFADLFVSKIDDWSICFDEIYRIFPLRKSRTELVEWKPIVELFNSILSETSYPKENLIAKAILFAKIQRYGTWEGYNIRPPKSKDVEMCIGLLKYNLLIIALNSIGVLQMESGRMNRGIIPDRDIESFLSLQGYDEVQSALFLLGVLVGKIGVEQYKMGDEKKSVLDK